MLTKKYPSTTRIVGIVLRSYIPNSGAGQIFSHFKSKVFVNFPHYILCFLYVLL